MIQEGSRNSFLQGYLKTVSFVQAILLSDRDGTQLNVALAEPLNEERYRQISSMLIAALNQTNDNINKVATGIEFRLPKGRKPIHLRYPSRATWCTSTISRTWC